MGLTSNTIGELIYKEIEEEHVLRMYVLHAYRWLGEW